MNQPREILVPEGLVQPPPLLQKLNVVLRVGELVRSQQYFHGRSRKAADQYEEKKRGAYEKKKTRYAVNEDMGTCCFIHEKIRWIVLMKASYQD